MECLSYGIMHVSSMTVLDCRDTNVNRFHYAYVPRYWQETDIVPRFLLLSHCILQDFQVLDIFFVDS